MARMTAYQPFVANPRVSAIVEQNDLTKPPTTRYWLQFGSFDLYLDRTEIEFLHRDLDCLLGDPDAHSSGQCAHQKP